MPEGRRVIAYARVSTEEQASSGLGLADQRQVLETEAARRGWQVVCLLQDEGFSAASLERPAMTKALTMLANGDAEVLLAAKLDRVSRSLLDFTSLMHRAQRERWQLVVLDLLGIDTSTASGEMMANIMASFSQYERRLIGERTRAALAQRKQQGVRLGRPVVLDEEIRQRIACEFASGETLSGIARRLSSDGIPAARGGCWHASTVRAVLRSLELDRESVAVREAA